MPKDIRNVSQCQLDLPQNYVSEDKSWRRVKRGQSDDMVAADEITKRGERFG